MAVPVRKKTFPKDNRQKKATDFSKQLDGSENIFNSRFTLAGIIILTALAFSNSFAKTFLAFDDYDYIVSNPYVKSLSWDGIKKIFSVFHYANYHPLTTLSYAIEYSLFKLNAAPYHFINLLIHLGNICLVFVLLERLTPSPSPKERGEKRVVALIGALFFGIHPMHVESVSWISERKDVLYALFYISALISYIKYIQIGGKWLVVTLLLFLLSLLSKPAANTLPLIMVLFDYYYKRGWNKKIILEKIPFFLLALAFSIITIYAQKAGGALTDISRPQYTLVERFFVVSYALVFYIVRFFLPTDLCALHYAPKQLSIYYYLSPVVIAFIIWMVVRAKAMKQTLIFGLLFYLFTLILVIQIIPIGYVNVSERYSYIPYIGLLFIAGSFYVNYIHTKAPGLRYLVAAVAIVFAIISFQRNKVWHDTLSLFTDNSEKNPQSAQAQFVLGEKQYESGDNEAALVSYSKAIELDSTVAPIYFWRGNAYSRKENYPAAIADFLKAIQLKPNYSEAFNNIGIIYYKTQKYEQAVPYFSKTIELKPTEYIYQNRGTSYFYLKKYKEAIEDYNKALQLNATLTDAWFNRGVCHLYLQQVKEACEDWNKASSMGFEKANPLIEKYCRQ